MRHLIPTALLLLLCGCERNNPEPKDGAEMVTPPDGSVSTGSDYLVKRRVNSNQVIAYTGHGPGEDYELVEGAWVFGSWYKNQKVIEHKFTTCQPDQAEIDTLKPLLEPGSKVAGQEETAGKPFSRFGWPRLTVGKTG